MDEITSATAELVGGPIDGQTLTVPVPPPYEWRRYAEPPPLLPLAEPLPETYTITARELTTEHYRRDLAAGPDGVWRYRWVPPTPREVEP